MNDKAEPNVTRVVEYTMGGHLNDTRNWASFDLSLEMLAQVLKLPPGAKFERMHMSNRVPGAITLVVSHPDFKEVHWGEWLPQIVAWVQQDKNGQYMITGWHDLDEPRSI